MAECRISQWTHSVSPSRADLEAIFRAANLSPSWWSNGPHDRYAAHSHSYDKVLYCVHGSITFRIEPAGDEHTLHSGDRLDIPPGTTHSAVVGAEGVTCIEAPRH